MNEGERTEAFKLPRIRTEKVLADVLEVFVFAVHQFLLIPLVRQHRDISHVFYFALFRLCHLFLSMDIFHRLLKAPTSSCYYMQARVNEK